MTAVNLLPALDSATESALRESIKRFGVLVPVIYDQYSNLVDGHHRLRIAKEVGLFPPPSTRIHLPTTEPERSEALVDMNDVRRPRMSVQQRRQIVGYLRSEGHSQRAIAGAVGVTHKTVQKDLEARGDQSPPERVTGEDGKSYPATREKVDDAPPSDRTWKRNPADQLETIIRKVEGVTTPLGNRRDGETKDQLIDVGAAIIASDDQTLREWENKLSVTIQRLTRLRTGIKGGL